MESRSALQVLWQQTLSPQGGSELCVTGAECLRALSSLEDSHSCRILSTKGFGEGAPLLGQKELAV